MGSIGEGQESCISNVAVPDTLAVIVTPHIYAGVQVLMVKTTSYNVPLADGLPHLHPLESGFIKAVSIL